VGETERVASLVGGGLLAVYGLLRASPGGLLLAALGGALAYRGLTGHCPMYSALGVSTAEPRAPATSVPAGKGVKVEKSIFINRPAETLYNYWRNLENLPRFMRHIRSITVRGNRSHWVARGPLGFNVAWDAEIINDKPNELIAWRSLEGAEVDNAGSVHFQPSGTGTRVTVVLKYDPPAGRMGAAIAHTFGQDLQPFMEEDLRRFKQLMEAGEVATSFGPPASRMNWPLP
jgi:uncharacterized membrane protein